MQNEEFLFKLGQKIRILRTQKGYSQEVLSEKAGGEKTHVGAIEKGKANPSIIYLRQIAEALDCELLDLLNFTI